MKKYILFAIIFTTSFCCCVSKPKDNTLTKKKKQKVGSFSGMEKQQKVGTAPEVQNSLKADGTLLTESSLLRKTKAEKPQMAVISLPM